MRRVGSPPRMRGKPSAPNTICCKLRITPADAGKTSFFDFGTRCVEDHPRGCGENRILIYLQQSPTGSPPRMRGKQLIDVQDAVPDRITPADAGKTCLTAPKRTKRWDHPRGCGENLYLQTYRQSRKGSPPRMRGKPIASFILYIEFRITPADAGKTRFRPLTVAKDRDHPRGCGENCPYMSIFI